MHNEVKSLISDLKFNTSVHLISGEKNPESQPEY